MNNTTTLGAADRNLAVELVRATEAAAMAAARFLGRGDKNEVDGAAVDAMRPVLGTVSMRGLVVIGEGEKDEAPMLFNGEEVGDGTGPEVDIAVDPVDGTTLAAKALSDAISVVALAERGAMFNPGRCFYLRKLAVPAPATQAVDPEAPDRGRRSHELALSLLNLGGRDLPRRHWWRLSGEVHITAVGSRRQLTGERHCSSCSILASAGPSLDGHTRRYDAPLRGR